MATKDFSILLEKLPFTGQKTDIAMVSGYNSTVQKITHLFNTNKGELPSDMNFGSDYFTYLFDPAGNKTNLESLLAHYIQHYINDVVNIKVSLVYYSENIIKFKVSFSNFDVMSIKNTVSATIEVKI